MLWHDSRPHSVFITPTSNNLGQFRKIMPISLSFYLKLSNFILQVINNLVYLFNFFFWYSLFSSSIIDYLAYFLFESCILHKLIEFFILPYNLWILHNSLDLSLDSFNIFWSSGRTFILKFLTNWHSFLPWICLSFHEVFRESKCWLNNL